MAGPDKEKAEGEAGATPRKPSRLIPLVLMVAGLLLGGGGATAYFLMMDAQDGATSEAEPPKPKGPPAPPEFVELNRLTIPLVDPEGALSGYMNLDLKFEVKADEADFVKARIPMVRHAINQTLSSTSVADANNPQLLDYPTAQTVLRDAVNESLGKPVIRTVQITTALPI